jgi:hypothetical protein
LGSHDGGHSVQSLLSTAANTDSFGAVAQVGHKRCGESAERGHPTVPL